MITVTDGIAAVYQWHDHTASLLSLQLSAA